MNNHLLPYPYNQTRSRRVFGCGRLAEALYHLYFRVQPPLPRLPSGDPENVVCVSDTHDLTPEIPDGGLLIHAGDLTQHGSYEQLQRQLQWLSSLPHSRKVVVAGNHDLLLDSDFVEHFPARLAGHCESSISSLNWSDLIYLNDSAVTLTSKNERQLKIYGSPRTPEFGTWAFQYPAIRDIWTRRIPHDADIVVVHGPPALHCDGKMKGDGYLLRELRRVKPKLVVFGHVHDGYGEDMLMHDGVQSAYEDIILQRSGILSHLWMCFWMVVTWFKFLLGLPQPKMTKLVNAAIAPGTKNKAIKKPVVLEI